MTLEKIRQVHIKWGISELGNKEILKLFNNSYSEEEVKIMLSKFLDDLQNGRIENLIEWFNQNKKQ
jgi:hypothetical protein